METPIKMDDLGVPLFLETPKRFNLFLGWDGVLIDGVGKTPWFFPGCYLICTYDVVNCARIVFLLIDNIIHS